MAKREYFKTADGSSLIPVADGDFYTDLMSASYEKAIQSSIEFYSDAAGTVKVTPTAGTVTVTGTPNDSSYYSIEDGTFDAADAYLISRVKPNAIGCMTKAKITLSGVTGAAYVKAFMWRS